MKPSEGGRDEWFITFLPHSENISELKVGSVLLFSTQKIAAESPYMSSDNDNNEVLRESEEKQQSHLYPYFVMPLYSVRHSMVFAEE